MKLMLVMPATNATSERSFSAEKRIKAYLRTTVTQERLNSFITLHIHKERTGSPKLLAVSKVFVVGREGRLSSVR